MGKNQVRQRQSVERVPIGKIFPNNKSKKTSKADVTSVFDLQQDAVKPQQETKVSLSQPYSRNVVPKRTYRNLWIGLGVAALIAAGAIFFRPAKKEYERKFVVIPADESSCSPEEKEYIDSISKGQNEMRKRITNPHEEKVDYLQNVDDPIAPTIGKFFSYLGSLIEISHKNEEKKEAENALHKDFSPLCTKEDSAKVAENSKKLEDNFDFESYIKEYVKQNYDELNFSNYNYEAKTEKEDKKNAENPMVVKEKEAEKAEAKVQQTVVPETVTAETKTNTKLKPEIKVESKFIKKYVIDFIKRDLISKPANYTETINSFIKEFGYKPNNDEIAEYVIAKKGDCVSGILIKAKEKELGRNLTGKEIAAIGKLANNIQIRRKTEIKGATNDFIIAGDTIPTREVKKLFN